MHYEKNYRGSDGACTSSLNYLWGALLARIGMESLVEIDASGHPVPPSGIHFYEDVKLEHIPYGGRFYSVVMKAGKIEIIPH